MPSLHRTAVQPEVLGDLLPAAVGLALVSFAATWFVLDGARIVHLDSTGADTIAVLADELAALGKRLVIAGVYSRVGGMLDRSGALARVGAGSVFPTLRSAVEAFPP